MMKQDSIKKARPQTCLLHDQRFAGKGYDRHRLLEQPIEELPSVPRESSQSILSLRWPLQTQVSHAHNVTKRRRQINTMRHQIPTKRNFAGSPAILASRVRSLSPISRLGRQQGGGLPPVWRLSWLLVVLYVLSGCVPTNRFIRTSPPYEKVVPTIGRVGIVNDVVIARDKICTNDVISLSDSSWLLRSC